jgi:uncharacterized protein YchJ
MINDYLTPAMLEEHYNYFLKEYPLFETLDTFLGAVVSCMNMKDDSVFQDNMIKVLSKTESVTDSDEDSDERSEEYIDKSSDYFKSIISLMRYLEYLIDEQEAFDVFDKLFIKFCELYKDDLGKMRSIIIQNGDFLLETFFTKFDISLSPSIEIMGKNIENKTNLLTSAACIAIMSMLSDSEETEDFNILQTIFSMIIVFVTNVNASQYKNNQSFEKHNNGGSHIGRNDPCPCGSGKKYKKCCEGKLIS